MYNTSEKPNLKPFRDFDPHEVVNLFAHVDGDVNKGTFVKLKTGVDPDQSPAVWQNSLENVPSSAYSYRAVNPYRVETAASGDKPFGITLYDVKENNAFGEKYIYRPRHERSEQEIVVSGETVPILKRGIIEINGFSGAPDAGSGAIMHPTVDGQLLVVASADPDVKVGTFLSQAGSDGYAIFQLEL